VTEQDNRSFPQNTVFPNGYEELRDSLVVVARSWENIDWLKECKRPFVVYNKGKHDIPFPANCLPNIGRDGHTYLQYIVENYYNLRDYTFFIQGDPFEKCPHIMRQLNQDNWHEETIQILCEAIFVEEFHGYPSGPTQGMKKLLKDIGLYENEYMMHVFGMGTQYIVHKKYIQNKSLRWWENAYNVYIGDGSTEHMRAMAYKFEKIFLKIFTHTENYGYPIKDEP
jgi:hypothetical protein